MLNLIQQLPTQNAPDIVTPLAQAHAVLAIRYHRKKPPQIPLVSQTHPAVSLA
jgi:hypothetical protein